jgi:hypothetical protein
MRGTCVDCGLWTRGGEGTPKPAFAKQSRSKCAIAWHAKNDLARFLSLDRIFFRQFLRNLIVDWQKTGVNFDFLDPCGIAVANLLLSHRQCASHLS